MLIPKAEPLGGPGAASFAALVRRAAGVEPYPYQARIAEEGLPEALCVPTGAGKTLAVVLGWLYRRRYHPDPEVRTRTPHWLVIALPMRALVSQTMRVAAQWLGQLGLTGEVGLYQVVGGLSSSQRTWRDDPVRDAVLVGTVDMLVSRALNRGYGDSRWVWPVDFGLFNNGTHWVLDEVQLMAEALPTTRQLQGFRDSLGTALPTSSTWMSATLDPKQLETADRRSVEPMVGLSTADEESGLGRLLNAGKTVREVRLPSTFRRRNDEAAYLTALAEAVRNHHKPASRTLVVLNSVRRAQELYSLLQHMTSWPSKPGLALLHSRFRPADRAAAVERALAPADEAGPGSVVVATQVIEAGVDMSCRTMVTEAAPWSSVVQRAGRCNRAAEAEGAELWWVEPLVAQPYDQEPVSQSVDALRALEGQEVTPASMQAKGPTSKVPARHVLRRRDLLELFDTLPDLSGADTDVSRFIREAEDTDVEVAWRELATTGEQRGPGDDEALPAYEERCRVPLGRARQWLKELEKSHKAQEVAWRLDHLSTGPDWVRCSPEDLRPGLVLIVPASLGGYEPGIGWLANSKAAVQVVGAPGGTEGLGAGDLSTSAEDLSTSADPGTCASEWQSLYDHLCETKKAAEDLLGLLCGEGSGATLRQEHKQAIVKAAAIHDIGKAHPVFQASLEQLAQEDTDGERAALVERPWAKSGLKARLRHSRRWFRHELASALAVLQAAQVGVDWLADEATDLVAYLVASHHGRARLGFRSLPGEEGDGLGEHLCALGVRDGDLLPEVRTPLGTVPALSLSLSPMLLGRGTDGGSSWSARMLALRDNPDLGPFRLGFAESVVRLADWRASAAVAASGRSATRLEVKGAL